MKYKTQTTGTVILKCMEGMTNTDGSVSFDHILRELGEMGTAADLHLYSANGSNSLKAGLREDMLRLEKLGWVRRTAPGDDRYQLTSMGAYFALLFERPEGQKI